MAFLEQRGNRFRLIFRFRGVRYTHSLHTSDQREADAILGGVERTLLQIQQRLLFVPETVDPKEFILTGGQPPQTKVLASANGAKHDELPTQPTLTFKRLTEQYLETLTIGAVEPSSLCTIRVHLRHLEETLGATFAVTTLGQANLQAHINRRTKDKGIRKRPLKPATMQKEIATFRAMWNWAAHAGLVTGSFPNRGLMFPKSSEKPPFQTWCEIERQIAAGHLTDVEQQELWDCLFLSQEEVAELLAFVKIMAIQRWIYPMFSLAAHTGTRRSELIRAKLSDLDLDAGSLRIQEKKRKHGQRTSRRVPLSVFLVQVLRDWLNVHPGGPSLFAQDQMMAHSKKRRTTASPITKDEAHDHFKRTLAGSKWSVLRGWHVLRHSFCSCCAAKGIDQRLINAWVGHQTEEMVQRYRHLFPGQERLAIETVFGG